MNWIKNLSQKLNEFVRLIIIVVLLAYIVYTKLVNYGGILPTLQATVPFVLIVGGILYLQLNKKEFAAHLALFVGFFLSVGTSFLNSLLSLRFKPIEFLTPLKIVSFVELVAFVYLALMLISLYFTLKPKVKVDRKDILLTAVIAFTFFYLRGGFYLAIGKLLLPAISLMFGLPLASILFLVAGVAEVPFDFISRVTNQNLLEIPISYYLFSLFAFYLIYGAVKGIIKEIKK